MNNSLFIPYGSVKIQNLPVGMWNEIKHIDNDNDFVKYLNDKWSSIELFLGSKDKHGIRNKSRLNWSSIKHIYGMLTSRILRGGGSKLTTWSLWCHIEENTIEFKRLDNINTLTLKIPNRIKFELSPSILCIGGDYFEQLKKSSELIHNLVAANVENVIKCNELTSLDEIDLALKRKINNGQLHYHNNSLKLCGKVDYLVSKRQDKHKLIPIDVNDLHGGLYWVDLFKDKYEDYFGYIEGLEHDIVYYFCRSFINYYLHVKGTFPKNILICLDDYDRWAQDNGMNYIEMKKTTQKILKTMGVDSSVALSYMSNYKDSLYKYIETNKLEIPIIDEKSGFIADNVFCDFDLVVRIYRKIHDKSNNSFYTTRQLLKKKSFPFIIHDQEEIRPAYYKDNVHGIFNNIENIFKSELIEIPKLIGIYNLEQSNLADTIINDVLKSGYNEFVVKLNEKTPYTDISALFYSTNNKLHKKILYDNLKQIKRKAIDIKHIVVEPLYGDGFIHKRKIEIRTINIAQFDE